MKWNSFVYIITCRNHLEVAAWKHPFFLAVLKLDRKDTTMKLKAWEEPSL